MARTLTQGLSGREGFQLGDHFGRFAEVQPQLELLLERPAAEFGQAIDLDTSVVGVDEIVERVTTPEPQCVIEQLARSFWILVPAGRRVEHEHLEPSDVDTIIRHHEDVAGRPILEIEASNPLTQPEHQRLQRRRVDRGLRAPDDFAEPINRDHTPSVKDQRTQESSLALSSEHDLVVVVTHTRIGPNTPKVVTSCTLVTTRHRDPAFGSSPINDLCTPAGTRSGQTDSRQTSVVDAMATLIEHGMLLESARGPLPNVAELIAGERISGSWWGTRRAMRSSTRSTPRGVARCRQDEVGGWTSRSSTVDSGLHWSASRTVTDRAAGSDPRGAHGHRAHRALEQDFPDWVPNECCVMPNACRRTPLAELPNCVRLMREHRPATDSS